MKNITKKQMITLTVLIAVLVLVIAVQYFYRPVLEKKSELADKVENMTMVYEDMKMLAAYYSIDAVSYKEAKEELATKRSEFLPFMENSQQDDMITNMLVASNISIESSEISELVKETVRVECAVDKEKEESVDGYSAIAMYPEGGKVVSDDGDYVSQAFVAFPTNTGRTPVAIGSRVPACPIFFVLSIPLSFAATSNEVNP